MTPVPLDQTTRHCLLLLVHDELVRAVAARLAEGVPPEALTELVAARAAVLATQLDQRSRTQ